MSHKETGAAFQRGNRPLSPHLQVYRLQITSALSILHRITGTGLTLGAILLVWWLVGLAVGGTVFECIQGLWTSWIGKLLQLGFAFALSFHLLNGIRHLFWDAGMGLAVEDATKTGWAVVIGSVILTLAMWIFT